MAEVVERHSIETALLLATDVCLSLGAFALSLTGHVRVGTPEPVAPDVVHRIEHLARSCLDHPAGRGREIFWSSEVVTDAGGADRALSCAVVPIWLDRVQAGFLGIVDTWLPEPDEEQRSALLALAAELAPEVVLRPTSDPVVAGSRNGLSAYAAPSGNGSAAPVSALAPPPAPSPPAAPEAAERSCHVEAAELVGALDDGVICLDTDGVVVLANRPAEALYGIASGASLVGSPLPGGDRFWTEDGEPLGDRQPGLLLLRDGVPRSAEVVVGEKQSQRRFTVTARPFTVGGSGGALVVMHDTTEEWLERQRLSHYAMYDPLTGLANRYLLVEELRRMQQGLVRRGGAIALVYLDLDRFKAINDEHGHDMGDEVLSAVARRLRGAVRGDDVVARLGGDEFVLAHLSADSRPDGDLVVSRLGKVLSAPFRVRGQVFDVGVSIGWVSSDRADVGPEALLARADRAMYRSKRERVARRTST